jgi:hypothetical protein
MQGTDRIKNSCVRSLLKLFVHFYTCSIVGYLNLATRIGSVLAPNRRDEFLEPSDQ